MNVLFHEIVSQANPQVREIAIRARALIQEVMPNMVEVPWPKQKTIGYGIGPKKMSEHFGYLGIYQNHVNLGFHYGSELPDPEKLLQGSGKRLRHIKIKHIDELKNPAIRQLIEVASTYLPNLPDA